MKISNVKQLSDEWHQLKKGRIGGTRFGQVLSSRKNRLVYTLLDERLSDFIAPESFINADMQFGIDNEEYGAKAYMKYSGIRFGKVGAILSDISDIHIASPDRLNRKRGIVLEIKSTMNGDIHMRRFFEGVDSDYMPQIINYFAVSDDVKEVHWVSYCPFRAERPLVIHKFTRDTVIPDGKATTTINEQVEIGRQRIKQIESDLIRMEQEWKF